MEKLITQAQLVALNEVRWLPSPGGAAIKLKVSRQRVHQLYQKRWSNSGLLAWKVPFEMPDALAPWHRKGHYVVIDFGPREGPQDPAAWQSEDLDQVVADAVRRYELEIVERARSA